MKIKKNISRALIFFMALIMCAGFSGCTVNEVNKKPDELIKENFAGEEFSISFSSDTLDNPIEDMTYTANGIPKLPAPSKIGYIFEGWFFDKDFVMPYSDGSLMLMMQDVTLYPKWSKESFVYNGTYEIEFDAHIVEGSVKKGSLTDKFGGFRDLSNDFMPKYCHIEKSDSELLLKLQFESGANVPFASPSPVYTVSVSNDMSTDIYIKDKIDSLADTVKTIYIKIDDWELSSTLYLDVVWVNYENEKVTAVDRANTATSYKIALDLTKIIGFGESFADPEVPLEEGYYLAKSYFRKEDNGESMGSVFNPVYSYIYSDGHNNYKLIKQNLPYVGLVANRHPLYKPTLNNYYDSMNCFVANMLVFDINQSRKNEIVKSEFYPETYNAGYYHKTVTEFHADTGKYYNVIDLDSDLTKEYIALTAVSGFMERADGMGYIRQVLWFDYDNLIKIPDCDYKPLEGDSYEYQDKFNFYPGNVEDLDVKNIPYDSVMENGISIVMPNLYYEAIDSSAAPTQKRALSSRVEVVPTRETNGTKLSESRYKLGEFLVSTKVYGYDVRDGKNLFLDRMNPQSFSSSGYNNQLRDVVEIRTGKMCKRDEVIDIAKLFKEKVNRNIDFIDVTYQAFKMNGNKVDYNSTVVIKNKQIVFKEGVAIEFKFDTENGKVTTLVELTEYTKPTIRIYDSVNWKLNDEGHYVSNGKYAITNTVLYPKVDYSFGTVSGKTVANFYEDEDGKLSINPAKTTIFYNREGYHKICLVDSHSNSFSIGERDQTLVYEINNQYGEKEFIYFDYISQPQPAYTIKDEDGNTLTEQNLTFDYKTHERKDVSNTFMGETFYGDFKSSYFKKYTHIEGGREEDYKFLYYNINSNDGRKEFQSPDTESKMIDNIDAFLSDKSFGTVELVYGHGPDRLYIRHLYKISFDGKKSFEVLDFKSYYTDTEYTFKKVNLVGSNMEAISQIDIKVVKLVDGKPVTGYVGRESIVVDDGMQYKVKFLVPGTFRIALTFSVPTTIMGNPDVYSEKYEFYQTVRVESNHSDITITYVTDERHPFKGGLTEKTVTYNLADGITLLGFDSEAFDFGLFPSNPEKFPYDRTKDKLFKWVSNDNTGSYYPVEYDKKSYISGEDFINKFNSDHITFVAKWEIKFEVKCDINGTEKIVNGFMSSFGSGYTVQYPHIRESIIPEGYVFAGWTGGFLGNGISTWEEAYLPYRSDYYDKEKYGDYFSIKAVFKKVHKVDFEVDSSIADPVRSTTAVDGKTIESPEDKLLIQMKDSSYKFVGYYVKGDENKRVLSKNEFLNYKINKDTTFVAVFDKKAEVNK